MEKGSPVSKGMRSENRVRKWFHQIRGPFLILSVVLVLIGVAAAFHEGFRNWGHGLLLMVGVVLAHVSVNLFNELSDYRTKIDEMTVRTPFSGGSGLLQGGKTSPRAVKIAAYGALIGAAGIGFYFCVVVGWFILVFMITGGLAARFYTSYLARWLLGEFVAGLTLGIFVVLGGYYVLTGTVNGAIVVISVPPGILTALLLLLNEFPDAEADKKGGRHHLVIHFGKKRSAVIYAVGLTVVYSIVLAAPFFCSVPYTVLVALATLPLAIKTAAVVLKHPDDTARLIPALGLNVLVVILTDLLLAVGFFV